MKIVRLDTWIVSVPYLHDEISSRVARGGVTDTIMRLTTDNGLVGWGECTSGSDAASIEQPGLGIEVDETKVQHYHECYLRDGQFLPYRRADSASQ